MASALNLVDTLIQKIDNEDQKEEKDDAVRFSLGYWNISGYAGPARMMLLYKKCKFKNIMYDQRHEWYDIKFSMNLDFPNVPYLIDHKNNIRFTESLAIYSYLERQLMIGSQKDPQKMYNDMVIGVMKDFWRAFADLCYRNYPEGKDKYIKETIPPKLKALENWLKNGKRKWFSGDNIATCDFITYYILSANFKLQKNIIDKETYPELQRFYDQFDSLPFMKEYKALGYADLPLNGASAKFR